jgi:calcium-dependent protein kinase
MGSCNATTNKSKSENPQDFEGKITPKEDKENNKPHPESPKNNRRKDETRHSRENRMTKQITGITNRSNKDIAINSNLIISKTQGNPEEFYIKESNLGEGLNGWVYKVKHKLTGSIRAMKMIKKDLTNINKEVEKEILNEIEMLRKLDHSNIVKLYEFYHTFNAYYLLQEYCSGGELFQQIVENAPFNEDVSAYLMYQILSSVSYCHKMNIIHRQLKPENILIERKEKNGYLRIKLIDFGTAKIFGKNKVQKRVIGSSYYIAPEVLSHNYNEKCDLWSCGVIMYILLTGRPPFGGDTNEEIMIRIKVGKYDMSSSPWNRISKEAKNLVTSLMQKSVPDRLTADQALNHQWFKNLNTKNKLYDISSNLQQKFIHKLKVFRASNVLQTATLAYLVHNFSQHDEIQDAYKLFNRIDINCDGKIDRVELKNELKNFLNNSEQELNAEVNQIFENMDVDNNGYLECEEFVRAVIDKEKFMSDNILEFAFRFFDKDGSNEITANEIKEVFCQNQRDRDEVDRQIKAILDGVDINGDGTISLEEFKTIMRNILKA